MNIQKLIEWHERAILILRKMQEVQTWKQNQLNWIKAHGSLWYQLIPSAKKKIQAYDRFVDNKKADYIELMTNK